MDDLELEAISLYRQYGWLLPVPVKEFMHRLAARLEWAQLKEVMR